MVKYVVTRPNPTHDPAFGQMRNRTWGGFFDFDGALEGVNQYCYNITTPIILSLDIGGRPYYTFSLSILYKTVTDLFINAFVLSNTTDWMNFVFTANQGCELILTSDYCLQRSYDMWQYEGAYAGYGGEWHGGGMLNDTCGQFYMTAGAELKGYLWTFPLSDMDASTGWQ